MDDFPFKEDKRSYSEIRTFQTCNLQHYYRYFLRLSSREYEDIKYFIPGRIVHDSLELIYNGVDPEDAKRRVADEARVDLQEGLDGEFFDNYLFEVHRSMAYNMLDVFVDEILPQENYEVEETEYGYEAEVAGIPFVGQADQIYRRDLQEDDPKWVKKRLESEGRDQLRLLGEWKTASSSMFPSSSDYEDEVKSDMQSHLYIAALENDGMPVDGIVHTTLRKAPSKYKKQENYDTLKEHKEGIAGYYSRARTPWRREEVVWRPPFDELEGHLRSVNEEIKAFYKNPYRSYDEFIKPDPKGYPCQFCQYFDICRQGKSVDKSWSYKTQRS